MTTTISRSDVDRFIRACRAGSHHDALDIARELTAESDLQLPEAWGSLRHIDFGQALEFLRGPEDKKPTVISLTPRETELVEEYLDGMREDLSDPDNWDGQQPPTEAELPQLHGRSLVLSERADCNSELLYWIGHGWKGRFNESMWSKTFEGRLYRKLTAAGVLEK